MALMSATALAKDSFMTAPSSADFSRPGEATPPQPSVVSDPPPPEAAAASWDPMAPTSGGRGERSKTIGLLTMLLGTAALLLGLIPDAGIYIAGAFGAVAIALGAFGIIKSNRAMSIIGIMLATGGTILSFAIAREAADDAEGEDAAALAEEYGSVVDGPPVVDGSFEFTVGVLQQGLAEVGTEEALKANAQGEFVVIDLTVKNIGDEAAIFSDSLQRLFDTDGNEYSGDSTAGMYMQNNDFWFAGVNPGDQIQGRLVFDVPAGTEPAVLKLYGSTTSPGAEVPLD
jgi:hypothetical protein